MDNFDKKCIFVCFVIGAVLQGIGWFFWGVVGYKEWLPFFTLSGGAWGCMLIPFIVKRFG